MSMAGYQTASFYRYRRLNTLLMSAVLIYSIFPIVYLLIASTKSARELYTTFGLSFGEFHLLQNLRGLAAYDGGIYFRWLANTLLYSTVCATGATLLCAMAAYAFAKYRFRGRDALYNLILGALMVPQTVLAIPIFLMLAKVGMVDTPLAVILPMMLYVPGVFLMRVYIEQSVPTELLEAARIDGANEFVIFTRIAFRLMAPGLITVFLLSFVQTWNNYFLPLVVLNSTQYLPITVGLSNWYSIAHNASGGQTLFTIILTGAMISVLPTILVFVFMQRFWQRGLTAGAVK
ncbi:carbohydrate ABC transporter permease [Paraburkholderia sp. DHOC27]|uniref:carbohydrate ABC transporter permease n=1 Tax=Paraburkholderia sp. DHOC27 TaxID=2303330 RepID=UPI000E3C4AB3|nr:carbohydrate ABC transporter permease [Paraburkholderia sp. DHOC27]RFU49058.1 carbohydrate ABC transporter permease [Paraburkholderia sp. DHOC27]